MFVTVSIEFPFILNGLSRRKLLMRWTVLSSDALVFFPAVFYFIVVYYSGHKQSGSMGGIAWHIAIILLNPCLILIDHGHFQFKIKLSVACSVFLSLSLSLSLSL